MTEVYAGGWTVEKLKAQTAEGRYTIWDRARKLGTPEGDALAHVIATLDVPYAETGGISMSDPRVLEMRDIIESPEGRISCEQATADGLPALAGVEPTLRERMGDRYGAFSQITITAGSIVGELMRSLGYEIISQKPMPEGSVAQTATVWRLRT